MDNHIWGDDWQQVRDQWLIDPSIAFLNHGSFGATPLPVLEAQNKLRYELERQPVDFLIRNLDDRLAHVRKRAGAFLNADPEGIALVPNATTAINHVVHSLQFKAGDEILVSDQVYPGIYHTLAKCCEEAGAKLIMQPVPLPKDGDTPGTLADAFLAGLSDRTTFVVIDHIASATGLIFPIEQVVTTCRERNILCMVDAAHAPGMLPVDIKSLDPDFWTGNFHKWVCAPKTSAALYVRDNLRSQIHPAITSLYHGRGYIEEFKWVGTTDPTPHLAVPAAIDFLDNLGWDRVMTHNHTLAQYGRTVVSERIGIDPPIADSADFYGSMSLIRLPDELCAICYDEPSAGSLRTKLLQKTGIEATFLAWNKMALLRISAQVYNAPEEYDRLAESLETFLPEMIASI